MNLRSYVRTRSVDLYEKPYVPNVQAKVVKQDSQDEVKYLIINVTIIVNGMETWNINFLNVITLNRVLVPER